MKILTAPNDPILPAQDLLRGLDLKSSLICAWHSPDCIHADALISAATFRGPWRHSLAICLDSQSVHKIATQNLPFARLIRPFGLSYLISIYPRYLSLKIPLQSPNVVRTTTVNQCGLLPKTSRPWFIPIRSLWYVPLMYYTMCISS